MQKIHILFIVNFGKIKKEKAEQILENAGKIVEDIQGLVEE